MPTQAQDLTPEDATQLEEGDRIQDGDQVVIVKEVEEGLSPLDKGEYRIWAALPKEPEQVERGIPVRKE
jgi:hypothetical protein